MQSLLDNYFLLLFRLLRLTLDAAIIGMCLFLNALKITGNANATMSKVRIIHVGNLRTDINLEHY